MQLAVNSVQDREFEVLPAYTTLDDNKQHCATVSVVLFFSPATCFGVSWLLVTCRDDLYALVQVKF